MLIRVVCFFTGMIHVKVALTLLEKIKARRFTRLALSPLYSVGSGLVVSGQWLVGNQFLLTVHCSLFTAHCSLSTNHVQFFSVYSSGGFSG